MSSARSAMTALASAAPSLAQLAVAGCAVSLVAVVVQPLTTRAAFARRALLLHALTVLLFVFSAATLVDLHRFAAAGAGAAAPSRATWLEAPRIVAPRVVATAIGATASAVDGAPVTAGLAVIGWLAGVLIVVVRVLLGAGELAAIRKRARISSTGARQALACRDAIGLRDAPLVLTSDEIDVPFASGLSSPAIIVPAASEQWTSGEWRIVLLHEASHIARGDVAMQWVRQLLLAVHWFNPAVHWMVRRADEACEGACDDAVVAGGTDAARYAHALVTFAGHRWPHAGAPAPTIAGRSGLERRIVGMLDNHHARRAARRLDRVAPRIGGVAGGLLLAIAWPRLVTTAAPDRLTLMARAEASAAGVTVGMAGLPSRADARSSPPSRTPQSTSDTTDALLGLGEALHDVNPIVRDAAVRALARWRSEASVARLRRVAAGTDESRRAAARAAIAAMESTR